MQVLHEMMYSNCQY